MRLTSVKYEVGSPKVSGKITIAFISDLHNSLFGKNQSELIAAVENMSPDIVIFGGDLADKTQDLQPEYSFILVRDLAAKYPCYYTIGNHESWRGDSKRIKRQMEEMGVTVLEGNGDVININGTEIEICGIYDAYTADYDEQSGEFIGQLEAVTDTDSDRYRILLAHFPEQIEEYMTGGFDLVLSGHAHGGQWAIPGLINGVYAPGQGFFPKYAGGMYPHGDTVHIVSRGLWKPSDLLAIPRLFIRPELVEITISDYS
ncbi:MAG: metallophosphoesterase [Eubacterium sp.]|nr:metallophosphoesterase [Eubacterium sp.]